ncbi:WD40-repeat-containing domain protein [Xylaria bambusicola]|uniref:WD40-repeat-containing domain protein n=1 Tax=Xylaria bambusicola TaxID=326684 RepID=UPI0020076148|nr:WD40-repeat-containing domain protein [Xylaria bambusicola]KAI0521675.1 WD40-repeat-containing domain protein [Xylaria bambusicola]
MSQVPSSSSSKRPSASSRRSSSSGWTKKLTKLLPTREKSPNPVNDFGLNTLYEPPSATVVIADFVFVHGLGGGSSTTWSLNQDPDYFWPKKWLPNDSDFNGIRIHSFGYNANWATWLSSPLDVHAFGQSLIEELRSDPKVKAQETPIVLIGHSLGGLVIKKACILSKTNPDFGHIANRLHSFYFLGTPHRGSNLASTLNNLLRTAGTGRRAYVAGLETKSEMIRGLNDSFRVHYTGIHLHTFYETQPTPPLGLIVDVESATLGYTEERPQLMNTNHRGLAKFDSVNDSNYRSLRNRLASTVQQIREERGVYKPVTIDAESEVPDPPPLYKPDSEQLRHIAQYLGVDRSYDDRLSSINDTRLDGSCRWLIGKASFQDWKSSLTHHYFCLKGAPASGKSTIASYVIQHLQENPTCFYFFKAGDKKTSGLSSFLRSMAFQMALVNFDIREAIFKLSQQELPLDIHDQRSIWNILFTGCVLHTKLRKPHFWVIDALDESADRAPLDEFGLLLSKIDTSIPLKIFITSRPSVVLDNMFSQLPTITELVTLDDLVGDIRLYVEAYSANLPVADASEKRNLIENIVSMSGGSFLWTVLVMRQLRDVIAVEEVHEVLREVPQEMNELYLHNIRRMESSRSKDAVKHMITWAICSVHPLTLDQMKDAIKLSLDITLARDLRTSLQYLCGQFLDVDKHSYVQVVHETARAFLVKPSLDSEFRVDYPSGHLLIAKACLRYLLSDELKYSRRRRSAATTGPSKTSMSDYACLNFGEHILKATSSSKELFDMLTTFFNSNVLSWIERVAQLKDLDCLNRTARHLSNYLGRRAKYAPVLASDITAWTVDLPKMVTQFGVNLLSDPSAIHTLVPPLCPRDSAVYRHFGYAEDGIKLLGDWNRGWGDRISSISHNDTYATTVTARDQQFAVGLSNGAVKVYSNATCEEKLTLSHGESVSALEFGFTTKYVASAGRRHVKLWDSSTGTQVFDIMTGSETIALAFSETETYLLTASRDKTLSAHQITDGSQLYSISWTDSILESNDQAFTPYANAAKISIEQQAMAIVFRSKPVQLWSLEDQRPLGACIRPAINKHAQANHIIHCVAFSPDPANPWLLVSYWDDVIFNFNIFTCKPLASTSASMDKVAVAPNGKTFAGGDGTGAVTIYDFETLQSLHRIKFQGDPVSSLAFTGNSLRIVDARGTHTNVWEPSVLVGQDTESHLSEPSESVHRMMGEDTSSIVDDSLAITSLYCCDETGIAFCGRNNGRVDTCNLGDPENTMRNLFKHRGKFTSVTCLDWNQKARIVASADSSGNFRVMQITVGPRREWSAELLVEARLQQGWSIRQVLVHQDGSLVLVSSSQSDAVWSVSTKKQIATIGTHQRSIWKWFNRPSSLGELLLFEDNNLKLYSWSDLKELTILDNAPTSAAISETRPSADAEADAISLSSDGEDLVYVQRVYRLGPQTLGSVQARGLAAAKLHIFDISTPETGAVTSGRFPTLNSLPSVISLTHAPSSPPATLPSHLKNPFLRPPLPLLDTSSPPLAPPRRRSFIRRTEEIPDIESIIGTAKRFNLWHLVFLSNKGWVCSVEIDAAGRSPCDTLQKYFFVPSAWRTRGSSLICRVRRNQDIIFVYNDCVFVVKNGLDHGEHFTI